MYPTDTGTKVIVLPPTSLAGFNLHMHTDCFFVLDVAGIGCLRQCLKWISAKMKPGPGSCMQILVGPQKDECISAMVEWLKKHMNGVGSGTGAADANADAI